MRKKGEHAFGSRRVERGCPPPQSLRSALRLLFLPPLSNPVFSGSGCFYTDNSTRKGGTVQRGLPRESFEQNEVDGYRAGRPQEPSGARSNPPEAVGHGVPPRERASSRWSSGCLHRSPPKAAWIAVAPASTFARWARFGRPPWVAGCDSAVMSTSGTTTACATGTPTAGGAALILRRARSPYKILRARRDGGQYREDARPQVRISSLSVLFPQTNANRTKKCMRCQQ